MDALVIKRASVGVALDGSIDGTPVLPSPLGEAPGCLFRNTTMRKESTSTAANIVDLQSNARE